MAAPARATRETELGLEIVCTACKEFWPADAQFFYRSRGGWHSWCRACCDASTYAKRDAEATRRGRSSPMIATGTWSPLLAWSSRLASFEQGCAS